MRIGRRPHRLEIPGHVVSLARTRDGVAEIEGRDDRDLAAGLGFAHATDRLVQMSLVRLIGQGRVSECLRSDAEALALDTFARSMGFARAAEADLARLTPAARDLGEAYCRGVNAALRVQGRPLELRLVGYRPEPWSLADILVTIGLMSYVGLAQTQQDVEKTLIEALRAGVDPDKLKRLFHPHLDGVDAELLALLERVRVQDGVLPPAVRFAPSLPRIHASNNWAVAARRSASAHALQCNDPHLEVNRLPPVWYEMVGRTGDDYRIGISMPGIPGLVMGRTRRVSFGFTYGFMDTIDYFVEEVREGRCRRGEGFRDLARRVEVVRRKGSAPLTLTFFEDETGVIEADPARGELEDGLYLRRAWTGHGGGNAGSLEALASLVTVGDVEAAAHAARGVAISCNWLLADREGRIAYQQSGRLPARRHSGLHPVPGWREDLAWRGLVPPEALAARLDPPEGALATANDDHNRPEGPLSINLCMGDDRASRIGDLLAEKDLLDLEDMRRIQRDLYSKQAERFLAVLAPMLPETPAGRLLGEWDLHYDPASRGATLFEAVYAALLREVFGKGVFGLEAWDALAAETYLVADHFQLFDRALLGDDPIWFGPEGREPLFRRVLEDTLARWPPARVRPWGEARVVVMRNLFFQGVLPRFLGFDEGPIPLAGSRATVVQGNLVRAHGRESIFAPSWRYLTDLGRDEAETALPGGPSGRRFSRLYRTGIAEWLGFRYKTLSGSRR